MDQIKKVGELISLMNDCDKMVLSAALAMLPDYNEDGMEVIFSAAARIAAEHFKDTDKFLDGMREMIRQTRKAMEEQNKE